MSWHKRADYFLSARRQLDARKELLRDAVNGVYDLEESLNRVLLWQYLFDYIECCERLGNGLKDGSIRRATEVNINTKPMDVTSLVHKLLAYEKTLSFERR